MDSPSRQPPSPRPSSRHPHALCSATLPTPSRRRVLFGLVSTIRDDSISAAHERAAARRRRHTAAPLLPSPARLCIHPSLPSPVPVRPQRPASAPDQRTNRIAVLCAARTPLTAVCCSRLKPSPPSSPSSLASPSRLPLAAHAVGVPSPGTGHASRLPYPVPQARSEKQTNKQADSRRDQTLSRCTHK